MNILCVDFGTSSLRAAVSNDDLRHVLSLDINSSIDSHSFPSVIYINRDGTQVYFGEKALSVGLRESPGLLFETSPKSWLFEKDYDRLTDRISTACDVSRRDLILGLVALAGHRALAALKLSGITGSKNIEVRVSHPIWGNGYAAKIDRFYQSLKKVIRFNAGAELRDQMPLEEFKNWVSIRCAPIEKKACVPSQDVKEPIAAALELIREPRPNQRRTALIVDVGAGTTDIACVGALQPSSFAPWVKRKLYLYANPISVYSAGDEVDQAIIDLINTKASNEVDRLEIARFKNDIRRRKRELFMEGRCNISGGRTGIELAELESSPRIDRMKQTLTNAVIEILDRSSFDRLPSHFAPMEIDVVMAGGGAKIGFLRQAVRAGVNLRLPNFYINFLDSGAITGSSGFDHSRLAVALGGTTPADEWPGERVRGPFR